VTNLKSLGKTVLLTTHYMDEAEHLADRVAIVVRGRVVAEGRPGELARGEDAAVVRFQLAKGATPLPAEIAARASANGLVEIETDVPVRTLHELTSWALSQDVDLEGLTVSRATLEETYLRLTREAEEADTAEGVPGGE
jgi:ABC-2 type transport system ATP-binding protein